MLHINNSTTYSLKELDMGSVLFVQLQGNDMVNINTEFGSDGSTLVFNRH